MGKIRQLPSVSLIAGITFADENRLNAALSMLTEKFGNISLESDVFDFNMTDYYAPEMGECLKKCFYCFERPINPETLPDIKLFTNELEIKLGSGEEENPERTVNIDPGYVTLAKLVLATTKDYSHRIYIGKGIFAEVTLRFLNGTFESLEHTFPDYRTELAVNFFCEVRKIVKGH